MNIFFIACFLKRYWIKGYNLIIWQQFRSDVSNYNTPNLLALDHYVTTHYLGHRHSQSQIIEPITVKPNWKKKTELRL